MEIKELDGVKLKDGREGTVLDIYENGTVYMVEICDRDGRTVDLPFLREEDIDSVIYRP